MRRFPRVSIIGAGVVGNTLGRALRRRGYPVVSVISRSQRHARALARAVGSPVASTSLADLSPGTELLLISSPDEAIPGIARKAAGIRTLDFRGMVAVHCSGARSSGLLAPLKRRGARTGSFHPLQTFPRGQSHRKLQSRLRGISYGIEGENSALAPLRRIVRDLGGRPVVVRRGRKPLYHVACVFGSNYILALLGILASLSRRAGLPGTWNAAFGPLVTATVENGLARNAGDVLTGPVVRRDFRTVDLHLRSLRASAPEYLGFYALAGAQIARMAARRDRSHAGEFRRLESRLLKLVNDRPVRKTSEVKR